MTNKIYLSFNRLYRLQGGDYQGAKLSFKIKHGDKVIAEGEHVGKTLSKFISPITIEETEITQQLTVDYVCTGNVEDVSVYPEFSMSVGGDECRVKDSTGRTSCVVGPINVELNLDATDAQKKLDELKKAIEGSKAFQVLSGEYFIKKADVAFLAGMIIGVNNDVEAIIKNALATQAETKAELELIKTAIKDSAHQAVIDAVKAAQKDFETHGALYRALGRKLRI